MTTTATRLLAAAAWLAAAATLALPAIRSDASFNTVSTNRANSVAADWPENYLRLYSQSTDPPGSPATPSRRTRARRCPPPPARTTRSSAALGGYKNQGAMVISRVLTLQALSPLPAGASPLTVTASLAADPVTGHQPITAVSFSNTDGSGRRTHRHARPPERSARST